MPTIDFPVSRPYQRVFGDPVARPLLLVRLYNGRRHTPPFLALVDSGADVSTFHPVLAAQIGLDPAGCRDAGTAGVGGAVRVKVCQVELEIEGRRFPAEVHFNHEMPPTMALLGRQDVFRQFLFAFDEHAERLLLRTYP
jgi:hypothetical protein